MSLWVSAPIHVLVQPAAAAAAGVSGGFAATTLSVGDLPANVWHAIIHCLDAYSKQQLKATCRAFLKMCGSDADMTQLSLSDIRAPDAALEKLAGESPAASCLCITPPRGRIALSRLNHRQRCEQHLAVFLDNLRPSPALTALDISTALSHISCSTLQLLVENLPQLHQLSLPPVATCGGTEADVMCVLQQLPCLCGCDIDCSLFRQSSPCSSLQGDAAFEHNQQQQELCDLSQTQQQAQLQLQHLILQHSTLLPTSPLFGPAGLQQQAAQPVQQDDQTSTLSTDSATSRSCSQLHKLAESSPSSSGSSSVGATSATGADSAAASTCTTSDSTAAAPGAYAGPWSGLSCLAHIQHLQLQHLRPGCVRDALRGVAGLPALRSLSVTGLCRTAAGLVLAPLPSRQQEAAGDSPAEEAADATAEDGGQEQWLLNCLQDLASLTRLELGVEIATPAHSSSATCSLVVPAHTGAAAGHPAGPAALLHCGWSCMHQLQELVLHGICLDSPLFAATLRCQRLTALHVGGLDLQQDVRAVTGAVPTGSVGLLSMRDLQVDQHFSLGPNSAAALLPELRSLRVQHAGGRSPDLSCLAHHQHLSSLDIAVAPGSAWVLHSLQLGYLVHVSTLEELRLAEPSSDEHAGSPGSGGSSTTCGLRSPGRHGSWGAGGFRGGPACGKSGSRWLPSCGSHLSQVTSLQLSGPVTDQALGQVPGQFPGLRRFTVDSSYFASDGGLQKLSYAPQLQLLVLRQCRHITDYGLELLMMGGGLKVVAVQGCAGIDERACHRIRKACRFSGSQLLWYGCHTHATSPDSSRGAGSCPRGGRHCSPLRPTSTPPSVFGVGGSRGGPASPEEDKGISSSSSSSCSSPPVGSAFLQRCWKEEQQQHTPSTRPCSPGPASSLVAAATAVWLEACPQQTAGGAGGSVKAQSKAGPAAPTAVAAYPGTLSHTIASSSWLGLSAAGVGGLSAASRLHMSAAAAASSESRPRRVSGGCVPVGAAHGHSSRWGVGGPSLAH